MAVVSMKQLLEAGVHFGHQTRRWNPKMAKYIFTERNGIYIIDLQKTVKKLDEAYNFVRDTAAQGGEILFVGTKKQAQESIRDEATRCGMHYVNARWLGGMMTNFLYISSAILILLSINSVTGVIVSLSVGRLVGMLIRFAAGTKNQGAWGEDLVQALNGIGLQDRKSVV